MSVARTIPVAVEQAFAETLTVSLPAIFRRWYGPIAPVSSADGPYDVWGTVGQTRVVRQVGGGSMREELVAVDAPRSFAYRLTDITGPLAPLVDHIDGRWDFAPVGTGTEITWTWRVFPTSRAASVTMPVFARLWRGFARQGLEDLAEVLLGRRSPR
ncbi:SRPBCC family protein [Gordonia sinesedis]